MKYDVDDVLRSFIVHRYLIAQVEPCPEILVSTASARASDHDVKSYL